VGATGHPASARRTRSMEDSLKTLRVRVKHARVDFARPGEAQLPFDKSQCRVDVLL
jgi:hypothetical protein